MMRVTFGGSPLEPPSITFVVHDQEVHIAPAESDPDAWLEWIERAARGTPARLDLRGGRGCSIALTEAGHILLTPRLNAEALDIRYDDCAQALEAVRSRMRVCTAHRFAVHFNYYNLYFHGKVLKYAN